MVNVFHLPKDSAFYAELCELVKGATDKEMQYIPVINHLGLMNEAANMIRDFAYDITHNNFTAHNATLEIHHSIAKPDIPYTSPLMIHLESGGDFLDTKTLVCYMVNTGIGGQLGIYRGEDEQSLMKTINTVPTNNTITCVVFDEHVYHGPMPFFDGERTIVSFHFATN